MPNVHKSFKDELVKEDFKRYFQHKRTKSSLYPSLTLAIFFYGPDNSHSPNWIYEDNREMLFVPLPSD